MVDTARFQLGTHAITAIGAVVTAIATDRPTTALEVATYVPLDVESIARILDSFAADEIVELHTEPDGFKSVRLLDRESFAQAAEKVKTAEHVRGPGFIQNLLTLQGDPDWCRKVRDQHRVLRAIAALGTPVDLETIAEHAELAPARVRAVLGDFEAEGCAKTSVDDETIRAEMPTLAYPPERFERNQALLTNVETRAVPVARAWWVVLGIAAVLLVLFIASRLAVP